MAEPGRPCGVEQEGAYEQLGGLQMQHLEPEEVKGLIQ